MARFFQATPPELVENFAYQPNVDLALQVIQKRDADIEHQLDSLELFRNLPVEYWKDADREQVERIQNEYSAQVMSILQGMQGDGILNTAQHDRSIAGLRGKVEQDIEHGDLGKIIENNQKFLEFQQKLNQLQDPAARERYKERVIDSYLSENPEGALSSIFSPPELYDTRDILQEFVASPFFQRIQADAAQSQITRVGGEWMVTEGNSTVELSKSKLGQAFKAFLNAANLQGYGNARQGYFDERWFDENGGYDLSPGTYLGNIMEQAIPALAYKQSSYSKDMQRDPLDLHKQQLEIQEAMTTPKGVEEAYELTDESNIYENYTVEGLRNKKAFLKKKNEHYALNYIPEQTLQYKRGEITEEQYKKYLEKAEESAYKNRDPFIGRMTASYYNSLTAGTNLFPNTSRADLKHINEVIRSGEFGQDIANSNGYYDFGYDIDGKPQHLQGQGVYSNIFSRGGTVMKPAPAVDILGKTITQGGKKYTVADVEPLYKSALATGEFNPDDFNVKTGEISPNAGRGQVGGQVSVKLTLKPETVTSDSGIVKEDEGTVTITVPFRAPVTNMKITPAM